MKPISFGWKATVLAAALTARLGLATSADVELTGKLRYYTINGTSHVQIDVYNDSQHHVAFGPNVEVKLDDIGEFHGRLYQYYGQGPFPGTYRLGTKKVGYIPLNLPGVSFYPGQEVRVRIDGEGQSNFGSDHKKLRACKKGTQNCA